MQQLIMLLWSYFFVVLTNLGSVPLNRSHVVDEDKADVVSLTSSGYGNPNLRNMCSRVDKLSENMIGMTEWRLYFVVCGTKSMRNGGYEVIKKTTKNAMAEAQGACLFSRLFYYGIYCL